VTGGRTDERDALRDRLLDLFSLYDPADPTVIDARTRMASALF
jgi:putative thioredoxin